MSIFLTYDKLHYLSGSPEDAIKSPADSCQWYLRRSLLILLGLVASVTGCQSSGVQANRLPAKYRQARDQNQTLNFAGVSTAGASDAIIAPRDLLKVSIVTNSDKEEATPIQGRVSADGTIDVPIVGARFQ